MQLLQLALLGVVVGAASGLLGIGGGVILIPGLILLFGFSQAEAQGTSLAAMIPPIGIFAAMVYYQHGFVRIPVAISVAVGFMLGAYIGAQLLPHVPLSWLRLAFGCVLLYLGFLFLFGQLTSKSTAAMPAALAIGFSAIAGWLRLYSGVSKRALPPPSSDRDYHI